MSRTIRVFPRRTRATPDDPLAFVGDPPLFLPEAERALVSVSFTWDLEEGERLARGWERTGLPVELGGPAFLAPEAEFVPGRFLKPGYVISSRGCPNHCWFCPVWRKQPGIVELAVTDGWRLQDDNLLACSEPHVRQVFAMLKEQPRRAELTGGLEAARLESWHVELLSDLRPASVFFAYDTASDREPLRRAGELLRNARLASALRAYVLIGYPQDTFENAEERLRFCWKQGFLPLAMLWRDSQGRTEVVWRKFQRLWCRPALTRPLLMGRSPVADEHKEQDAFRC